MDHVSASALTFEVDFVYVPRDAVAAGPFHVLMDDRSDPFIIDFLTAVRAPGSFLGRISHPSEVASPDIEIFVDPVTWFSGAADLYVQNRRLRVLMYFPVDPTAYLDFAKALGPSLGEVVRRGGLTPAALVALGPFLEKWMMARTVGGRVLPYTYYNLRDYHQMVTANAARIDAVFRVLADDESRTDYSRLLYGTNEQYLDAFANKAFGHQQYVEVVDVRPGMTILNCGVASGWETWYFLAKMQGRGRIYNFDPFISYEQTVYAAAHAIFRDNFVDNRILLGNEDGEVEAGVGIWGMIYTGPGLKKAADVSLPARRIDTLYAEGALPDFDYLKMDVEGAELDIIKGGLETIRKIRPKIAITIYHQPEHFWDFPTFLIENLENYRFYIRQYGYSRFETLLYCIPDEDGASRSGHEIPHLGHARASRTGAGSLRSYVRDVAPRTGFNGQALRVLTRVEGVCWDTARISAGPEVHPDHILCVIEDAAESLVVTRHAEGDNSLLSIGRFTDPSQLTWLAQTSSSTRDFVPVFGGPRDLALFAEHDRQDERLYLATERDGAVFWTEHVAVQGRIAAIDCSAGAFTLLLFGETPETLWLRRETGRPTVDRILLTLPGPLETLTTVSWSDDGTMLHGLGFVTRQVGETTRTITALHPDGSLVLQGVLDLPELTIVTTTVAAKARSAAAPRHALDAPEPEPEPEPAPAPPVQSFMPLRRLHGAIRRAARRLS